MTICKQALPEQVQRLLNFKRAQAATTFGEKLKQIGQAFAVAFLPVLEFAHDLQTLS